MVAAYYNEHDKFAAQWLRNLIAAGHIAPGDVDERDIRNVRPDELRRYTQCHFFAGIGGWSLALRLAGWPDERSVWTGSCPCQPFSAAGKGAAADDERHLWPAWFSLIAERRPAIVFGEQVEAAIGWGWLDAVYADLEGEGYACGAAVLPACGVGAPHIRNRVWFVADAGRSFGGTEQQYEQGRVTRWRATPADRAGVGQCSADGDMANAASRGRGKFGDAPQPGRGGHIDGGLVAGELGDAAGPGRQGCSNGRDSAWDCDWLPCTDRKARPVEPGTFPLAHGIPGRVGRLRAYGNAIVPKVGAEFIAAFMEHDGTKNEIGIE